MLLLTGAASAAGDTHSLNWLQTVAFAGHQTDYSGVFVYQYGNRVETSRITHVVETDGEYEKLESLDGPKREIVRHHGQVWVYDNHKMVQVDSRHGRGRFPSLLPEQLSALSGNYRVKEDGMQRVAGYNAQVILFQPRDSLRYSHKIWAHTDSGLLLKAAVLDDMSRVIEQYAFTQLKIGGDIDRSWIAPNSAAGQHGAGTRVLNRTSMPVNSGWVADALPTGFNKIMEVKRPMRGKHAPVLQLVFSDGLSAISIFIEPVDDDEDDVDGLSSRGAVNLYRKVIDKNLITVVGEVPPRTVMQVLDSVRYNSR
ncbi:MAG: MucB/RseB C-terminal domain-containing protein [Nitrosomonadales bacterium]|nr:MucB/RseB C-terminal domain-containing protein [Nitrosomonadales bacterium]